MSSLKMKTIHGLGWSALSQGGKQAIQFIITAILARLLSPNDFGLVAMATVFVNFAMIFSEMGISSALIQNQNITQRHYSSSFWLNVFVGLLLMVAFIFCSPFIASFYRKPELLYVLMILSLNFLLSSFTIVQQTILTKEMDFKKLALRDIIAVLFSGFIGIALALNGRGVWSLVYQTLSFTVINSILLWVLSPWRPQFAFSLSDIRDIFNYSANLTGFNILNYFSRNIDQLLIGKLLGSNELGYYSLAYKVVLYPLQNVSAVVGKVMFPAFSKIQDNIEKIRNGYLKMVKGIALLTFPLMAALFVLSPQLVNVFLGKQWESVGILLRIFSICGLFQSIGTTVGNIFLSQGRSDLQLKLQFIGTAIVIMAIVTGITWGVKGVAIFYTSQSILWVCFNMFVVLRLLKGSYKVFVNALGEVLLISTTLAILIFFCMGLIKQFYGGLVLSLFFCGCFYTLYLFKRGLLKLENDRLCINI